MGEGRDIPPDMARHTVREAADILGITTGAVRNRLSRGTLQSVKERGTVYVLLPDDTPRDTERDADDTPGDMSDESSALISQLRDEIAYLREENRRKDHLLAAALERIPPQLEPAQEPQKQAQSAEPRSDEGQIPEEPERAQRPFWRRWFGGGR